MKKHDEESLNRFCLSVFKKYYSCLQLNLEVFGKEHGTIMCQHIRDIINNSQCKNYDHELNNNMDNFIDKMYSTIKNKNINENNKNN